MRLRTRLKRNPLRIGVTRGADTGAKRLGNVLLLQRMHEVFLRQMPVKSSVLPQSVTIADTRAPGSDTGKRLLAIVRCLLALPRRRLACFAVESGVVDGQRVCPDQRSVLRLASIVSCRISSEVSDLSVFRQTYPAFVLHNCLIRQQRVLMPQVFHPAFARHPALIALGSVQRSGDQPQSFATSVPV